MPRAYFSFELPQELNEYKITTKASDFYSALWDLSQKYREMRKYGDQKKKYTAEEIEAMFYQILSENNVSLEF